MLSILFQNPEIRKYKRKFSSEILCGALWGVNLLVGTDSGLMLLDRSGHGKGKGKGKWCGYWVWKCCEKGYGFVSTRVYNLCVLCFTGYFVFPLSFIIVYCCCSVSFDNQKTLLSDWCSWRSECTDSYQWPQEQDQSILSHLAQTKDSQRRWGQSVSWYQSSQLSNWISRSVAHSWLISLSLLCV